jgi:hypothetical protein
MIHPQTEGGITNIDIGIPNSGSVGKKTGLPNHSQSTRRDMHRCNIRTIGGVYTARHIRQTQSCFR